MKLKFLTAAAFLTLILFAGESYAAKIPITGTAYSEEMGILHFDYKTAVNPGGSKFKNPSYYKGPKKQFYIDPYIDAKAFGSPSVNSRTVNISTDDGDCNEDRCFIKGFIWNDSVGWTALDGKEIGSGISDPNAYTAEMYPQIKVKPATGTEKHAITGYIWNKHTGWIRLSSNNNGVTREAKTQNQNHWGIWIDLKDPVEKVVNEYGVEVKKGRKIKGYAWSEKLGWIKFSRGPIDNIGFHFGAYTTWEIDKTAPISLMPAKVWFAVGINTGYTNGDPTTIIWNNVAFDYESGINASKTKIHLDSKTDGCPIASTIIPTTGNGGIVLNLTMPSVGIVKTAQGYCHYLLHAEIVNNNDKKLYIGDKFTSKPKTEPVEVFVRAGYVDKDKSKISWGKSGSSAIADGKDPVQYIVEPKDIAENPILKIDCPDPDCPKREITLKANFDNDMVFDLTQSPPPPKEPSYLTPVKALGQNLESINSNIKLRLNRLRLSYPLEFTSYAPSSTYSSVSEEIIIKQLKINNFNYIDENGDLPATSKHVVLLDPLKFGMQEKAKIKDETGELDMNSVLCSGAKNEEKYSCPIFTPAITTSDPKLKTGGLENVLSLGTPSDLEFTVNNFSTAQKPTDISIDNVFSYASLTGSSDSIMETRRITNATTIDGTDNDLAWTNPFELTESTRYEMYMNSGKTFKVNSTPFHGFYKQFHPSGKFSYYFDKFKDKISGTGTYIITGMMGIPKKYDLKEGGDPSKPEDYPDGQIDRNDAVNLSLKKATEEPSESGIIIKPATLDKKIQFTPQKFLPSPIKDVKLGIVQDVAYRFGNYPNGSISKTTAIYRQSPLISLDVRAIGMEAIGTVSGSKTVIDRKFDTVNTTGSYQIKEQMRRNIAKLTANIKTGDCKIDKELKLSSLPNPDGKCKIKDTVNNTMFAYYEGDEKQEVILYDNDGTFDLPELPYTLIIKGANLAIKSNLHGKSSFGIIMLPDDKGKGANVYIDPEPTNIKAILYTEGSVLSRNEKGHLYYGGEDGKAKELKNQLYWFGSIASRNTIAGTAQKKKPEGIDCHANDSELDCAKRYDFDYLRRFTVSDTYTKIANDGLFSGGGECKNGNCSAGNESLPPAIVLDENKIDKDKSELAPFFVKKDPASLTNPPPGFTVTTGLKSKQEIR